jgi:serine/threonine protein kinase/Flp pilus assembly protein TadD
MSRPIPSAPPNGSQETLVVELLEELANRIQAGEAVDVEAFLARHPDEAERLRPLLPAVQVLGELGRSRSVSVPPAAAGEPPSHALGDFRILREVGRGGMGVVYEAEQVSLGRRVALKVLPFAVTMDGRQLQRFQNEARAAAGLHHTNIVPVYYVGSERGVHYYAMQFIEGRDLASVIAQLRAQEAGRKVPDPQTAETVDAAAGQPAALPAVDTRPLAGLLTENSTRSPEYFRTVARLGIQAAEALDHAHQMGIVHRDIKPANLLVDAAGRLWVTDFGLAQVQTDTRLTMTGDLVGTLRYMSPEQALAKRVVIDHRTDVYSLGATLYELLTLQPAFEGSDRQELLRQIAFEEPSRPRRINKAIPAELETIVLKAMEKSPTERYATAKELADDLRHWLEDRPIRARRPSLGQRARKWARRHRAAVVAGVVCLLVTLVAGGGSVGWVLSDRAARQREAQAKVREAEAKVQEALEAATPGLRQGNPHDTALIAAVQRAAAQLDAGAVNPELRGRVEQLRRDLDMLAALENARLQRAAGNKETGFDVAGAEQLYAQAFAAYDVDLTTLSPQEAAERVRGSAIRAHLIAALYDWRRFHRRDSTPPGAALVLADDDPWRQRLLEATTREEYTALEKLAQEEETLRQPPANLVLLADMLKRGQRQAAAERLIRQAQQEHPGDFWINMWLAEVLCEKKPPAWAEAAQFYQAALALRPQSPAVLTNLGVVLRNQGKLPEAITAFRKAIELGPGSATAHNNLGSALQDQGRLDEAMAQYRQAIRINDHPVSHFNLACVLRDQGQFEEAAAEFRKTLRVRNDFAEAHLNLGGVLDALGQFDEAVLEIREALQLKKDFPEAQAGLPQVLQRQAALEKLPRVLKGEVQAADAAERVIFAKLCLAPFKRLYAASARFYSDAFAEQPQLGGQHRNDATSAFALAGCGQGKDADQTDEKERARLRRQALDWLNADLRACQDLLEKEPANVGQRLGVAHQMGLWLKDPDFAGVRDGQALAGLPAAERADWQKLWQEVEALRQRAAKPPTDANPARP